MPRWRLRVSRDRGHSSRRLATEDKEVRLERRDNVLRDLHHRVWLPVESEDRHLLQRWMLGVLQRAERSKDKFHWTLQRQLLYSMVERERRNRWFFQLLSAASLRRPNSHELLKWKLLDVVYVWRDWWRQSLLLKSWFTHFVAWSYLFEYIMSSSNLIGRWYTNTIS